MMRTGRIATSVGRELDVGEIPGALEDMEQRRTTGRLVAHVARS